MDLDVQTNLGLLTLRLCLGLFLAYHGYNKVMGGGRLTGTAQWFGSIGLRRPWLQARLAAATELGSGLLLAAGLLTPLAAAGMIGVMVVAIWVAHRKVGFFVFLPGQGWEYCATIAIGAFAVSAVGPGEWSVDHAVDLSLALEGWARVVVPLVLGVGGAATLLALTYRPDHGA